MTGQFSLHSPAPMPAHKRLRMQVGCPMRCTFCATGKGGFARNLAQHEIIDQVMTVQERMGARVSNVGEAPPCLPDRHVTSHVDLSTDPGPAFGRLGPAQIGGSITVIGVLLWLLKSRIWLRHSPVAQQLL